MYHEHDFWKYNQFLRKQQYFDFQPTMSKLKIKSRIISLGIIHIEADRDLRADWRTLNFDVDIVWLSKYSRTASEIGQAI